MADPATGLSGDLRPTGALPKIVDNHLVITFYINDSRVTSEVLERESQGRAIAHPDSRDRKGEAAARSFVGAGADLALPPRLPSACLNIRW